MLAAPCRVREFSRGAVPETAFRVPNVRRDPASTSLKLGQPQGSYGIGKRERWDQPEPVASLVRGEVSVDQFLQTFDHLT